MTDQSHPILSGAAALLASTYLLSFCHRHYRTPAESAVIFPVSLLASLTQGASLALMLGGIYRYSSR